VSGPIDIQATVVGAETVAIRFLDATKGARDKTRAKVQALGIELQRLVKESKLSGQSLNVRTGRLRRSVNEKTETTDTDVTSSVGTNVSYARAWELGIETVRAHLRRAKLGPVNVRAHQRQVNQKARTFLQPALAEMRPKVLEQLSRGVV